VHGSYSICAASQLNVLVLHVLIQIQSGKGENASITAKKRCFRHVLIRSELLQVLWQLAILLPAGNVPELTMQMS
jgi:hypothetical protein